MSKRLWILSAFFLFRTGLSGQTVETLSGKIEGTRNGTVYQFLGIPFAKPPIGSLRWKAPVGPDPWTTILSASQYAPVCPQKRFEQGDTTYVLEGNEDCLYLNIWTPKTGPGNRAVMVFIHGGGNQQGGASQLSGGTYLYSGKNLAERGDVVVVTIQYRLGPLGFLVHPGLEAENSGKISGNYAVLDQILALTWIKNNISGFGGDPSKVMIFGESAGGVNVGNLIVSPLAAGLFHRACVQSAAPVISSYPDARNKGIDFVNRFVPAGTDVQKIATLRSLVADSLLRYMTSPLSGGVTQMNWQPVLDQVVFTDFPARKIQSGNYNKVPLMVGSNAEEMSLSAPQVVSPAMVNALINNTVPAALQSTAHQLYPSGSTAAEARTSYVAILTDAQFTSPVRRTAQCVSQNQMEPVWRYFFTHKHTIPQLASYGSYHGMELFYEFNNWENATLGQPFFFKPADDSVQQVMLKYWVNFAKTGNPNGSGLPVWPQYSSAKDCFMNIKATPDGSYCGLRTARSDLWDAAAGFTNCTTSVETEDVEKNGKWAVFPNPSSGIFYLKLPAVLNRYQVTVYNSSGQTCLQVENVKQIDLTSQKDGLYLVDVTGEDIIFRGKVVKMGTKP